jgi:hypothetical protein
MRRSFMVFFASVLSVLSFGVVSPVAAAVDAPATILPLDAMTGVRVTTESLSDTAVSCSVEWLRSAESARIVILGPARVDGDAWSGRWDRSWSGVAPGTAVTLKVELDPGAEVVILAANLDGGTEDQLQLHLTAGPHGIVADPPRGVRVDHRRHGSSGVITATPLDPAIEVAATAFAEDLTNRAIPDGPTDCADSSPAWGVLTYLEITSAPAGAVTTAVTAHVTVIHPVMADLQIAMSREFGTTAPYLWHQSPGVNLDQDFTHNLPGIGMSPNAIWVLGLRDCVASATGTLDYWSIELTYDGADDIDLVADSVTPSATTVEAGAAVSLSAQGHLTGSGTLSDSFRWGLYLSADGAVTVADTLLGSSTGAWATNPGDTFGPVASMVTVPLATAPGDYYLGFIVDDTGVITESDETNNTVTTYPLTVTGGGGGGGGGGGTPNLVTMPCGTDPVLVDPGGTVQLRWRGMNQGSAATGSFTWGLFLSADASIDPASDLLVVEVSPADWAAGFDTGPRQVQATLDASIEPGTWYLGIRLDRNNDVTESNESDNDCVAGFVVAGTDQPPAAEVTHWLVAAGASAPGVGTSDWRTQISVANPTNQARTVSLYYVASGTAWPGTRIRGPLTVGPRAAAYFDDVLAALNPTSGLLHVELDAAGPVVTSRTYNLAAGGATFGQGIPALPLDGVARPSELILPMFHSVPNRYRTNLGLVQASAGSFQVEVSAYNGSGNLLGSKVYTLATAWTQINNLMDNLGLGTTAVTGGWIRVRLVSGTPATWSCYASVIDGLTGDPTYIMPVAVSPAP